ncbi:hypothetical protein OAS86_06245 [Gammaproteobacteria bacterium]|nr:hypothetical protein [Gammaproteobacteria bacterium]
MLKNTLLSALLFFPVQVYGLSLVIDDLSGTSLMAKILGTDGSSNNISFPSRNAGATSRGVLACDDDCLMNLSGNSIKELLIDFQWSYEEIENLPSSINVGLTQSLLIPMWMTNNDVVIETSAPDGTTISNVETLEQMETALSMQSRRYFQSMQMLLMYRQAGVPADSGLSRRLVVQALDSLRQLSDRAKAAFPVAPDFLISHIELSFARNDDERARLLMVVDGIHSKVFNTLSGIEQLLKGEHCALYPGYIEDMNMLAEKYPAAFGIAHGRTPNMVEQKAEILQRMCVS